MSQHLFDPYPFPKHLAVDLKIGHYKITAKDGKTEIVQGNNAKDAISKTTLEAVDKLEYLGFYNKTIVAAEDVIEQQTTHDEATEKSHTGDAVNGEASEKVQEPQPTDSASAQ